MQYVQADILNEVGFIEHGFFGRTGGVSTGCFDSLNVAFWRGDSEDNVIENRTRIAKKFGLPVLRFVILNQKHSDVVHVINSNNIKQYEFNGVDQAFSNEGDAIITNEKNLLIGVHTADCAPILMCDKDQRYIAAIHAGWRGAVGKVIENTISKLKDLGCRNLVAAIGPCMQKRYFEVQEDVIAVVDRKYIFERNGKTHFDMPQLVIEKLLISGVKSVLKLDIDTMGNDSYFSYRQSGGKTGLQFSGIMRKE